MFTETGGNGVVNYWRPQPWAGAGFAFDDVHLEDRNSSLVVPKTGLYLVYAQVTVLGKSLATCQAKVLAKKGLVWNSVISLCVDWIKRSSWCTFGTVSQLCYAVTRENNSFEVKVMSEGRSRSESKVIAQCSAGTSSLADEVTCYTSVVQVRKLSDDNRRAFLVKTR